MRIMAKAAPAPPKLDYLPPPGGGGMGIMGPPQGRPAPAESRAHRPPREQGSIIGRRGAGMSDFGGDQGMHTFNFYGKKPPGLVGGSL
jgi:hypothetical protein